MRLAMNVVLVLLALAAGCGDSGTKEKECESMAEVGNPCSLGKGECGNVGTLQCSDDGSTLECSAVPGEPEAETCDGKDNDCDGETDEEIEEVGGGELVGVCQGLARVCTGEEGWADPDFTSVPDWEADEVSCDGLDNDCDGEIDEDLTGGTPGLCPSEGLCEKGGAVSCVDGAWLCTLEGVVGWEEIEVTCDGLDNDCDGEIDEGLTSGEDAECSTAGVCAAGVMAVCQDGGWTCSYVQVVDYQSPETSCDGKDNDCDGEIDEDLTDPEAGACPVDGVCAGQVVAVCQDASWVCGYGEVVAYEPVEASCDGLDNDCDGQTDEELVAGPSDDLCATHGVCAGVAETACLAGTWVCDYSGVPDWEGAEVSCDGKDNDCDGEVDEGWVCDGGGCASAAGGVLKCKASIGGTGVPAIDAEGTVYIAAESAGFEVPYLAALSPADCSVLWEFHPQKEAPFICLPPVIRSDGRILFACNAMFSDVHSPVYVVTSEGQLESTIELPEGVAPGGLALASDGTFYFGDRNGFGEFYAFKPDGTLKWVLHTGGSEFQDTPARGPDGLIYTGTSKYKGTPEEKFYAIADNGASGAVVWEFAPPENPGEYDTSAIIVNASPALDGMGTVYVGILGNLGDDLGTTLYALDASSGAKKWHHTDSSSHASLNNSVLVGPTGTAYLVTGKFGDEQGNPTTMLLHALNPDGTPAWAEPTPFAEFSWNAIPAIGKDGNLYVAAVNNAYAIDGQTGEKLWTYEFTGAAYGAALGHSGVLYFVTAESLYALCTDSAGLADSGWPKALHDWRNTGDFSAGP